MRRPFDMALVGLAALTLAAPPLEGQESPRVEYLTTPLTGELGLPFSEVVRVDDMLYLSGMVGTQPGVLALVPGGMQAEARQALQNIEVILQTVGASRTDIVKCTIMLDDIAQWADFNEVYVEFFGDHRPARSAFGADGLALGAAVEIECIAAAP